ncbi:TetR/AcrR family transcriptional regulator [Caldimonas sp. KR1-144]|uniref:TetR/AcrR family transcriptional regulator n=1 Tax=Caldimonas sp. KR1-144 TaxID=3400911 RepID=UPI003C03F252
MDAGLDRATVPRRRRRHARPRELLEAALALVVEKGYAGVRAEDIAARAGVSKGTLYLYFPSKDDLLKALIAEGLLSHVAIGAHEAPHDRPSVDLLREVLTAWQAALMRVDAGGIFKLVYAEARNFPALAEFWSTEVIEPARRLVSEIVVRGIDRGEFRPVDPDVVVHALVLPIVFSCLHQHAIGPRMPPDRSTRASDPFNRHFDLVIHGLIGK